VFIIGSSPLRSRASDEAIAHYACQGGRCTAGTYVSSVVAMRELRKRNPFPSPVRPDKV
jgi:hypothetical protein